MKCFSKHIKVRSHHAPVFRPGEDGDALEEFIMCWLQCSEVNAMVKFNSRKGPSPGQRVGRL